MWNLPEETLFGCFVTTLNNPFETGLAQEDKGYKSGSESFNVPNPSAEHQESTMFPPWRIYPSILQTLANHQLHQSSMKRTHLEDTEVTVLHVTD